MWGDVEHRTFFNARKHFKVPPYIHFDLLRIDAEDYVCCLEVKQEIQYLKQLLLTPDNWQCIVCGCQSKRKNALFSSLFAWNKKLPSCCFSKQIEFQTLGSTFTRLRSQSQAQFLFKARMDSWKPQHRSGRISFAERQPRTSFQRITDLTFELKLKEGPVIRFRNISLCESSCDSLFLTIHMLFIPASVFSTIWRKRTRTWKQYLADVPANRDRGCSLAFPVC